jgi:hypothetical protein
MPKKTDGEGRYYLPPKTKKKADSNEECLFDLLGCSPDECDALVLALHAMTHKGKRGMAGAY